MPGRVRLGGAQQRPQALVAKAVQSRQRPRQTFSFFREPIGERLQVPLAVELELTGRGCRAHRRIIVEPKTGELPDGI